MSFGKLLAAGKSIVGAHHMTRYKVNPGVFLPKFISPRNPFVESPDRNTRVQPASAETDTGQLTQQAPKPEVHSVSSSGFPGNASPASLWRRVWRRALEWARKVEVLRRLGWRRRQPRRGLPAPDGGGVQGELSLDRVQVVRNDLRDADLEVVIVGAGRRGAETRQTGSALDRLATKIFETEDNVI